MQAQNPTTPKIDPSLMGWTDFAMAGLPERLRSLREQRNLTQVRLSELLRVSPRVYNRWEKGTAAPHLDTVIEIADILQVDMDALVGRRPPDKELKIRNYQLHCLVQEVDQLPDEDQKALVILMDSLIKKQKFAQVMGS